MYFLSVAGIWFSVLLEKWKKPLGKKKNSLGMQLKNKSAVCQLEYVIPEQSLP